MLFNSYIYIFLFLPLVFIIYFYHIHKRLCEGSKAFLIVASLFFYSYWNLCYLPLMLFSILFNFTLAKNISSLDVNKTLSKKSLLIFGIAVNLGLLSYYKYSDFFLTNFNTIFGTHIELLHLAQKLYFVEAWITSLSYTFQLYFDFSGYTDMAIGAALLFNIKLPINFNSPYKASSIRDFWRRWHITLSNFLKEYIYIPLGGNRKGHIRTYLNLFITFYLAGVWHGASWMFIIWGVMHGIAIIIQHIWKKFQIKIPMLLAWFMTFMFINFSWIFFRAHNLDDAFKVLKGMLGFNGIVLPKILYSKLQILGIENIHTGGFLSAIGGSKWTLLLLILSLIVLFAFKNSNELQKKFRPNVYYALFYLTITIPAFLKLGGHSEFLYFRF